MCESEPASFQMSPMLDKAVKFADKSEVGVGDGQGNLKWAQIK